MSAPISAASGVRASSRLPAASTTLNGSSILGGGFVGYNKQFNSFVLGLEGDVQGLGVSQTNGALKFQQNLLASINGRLGFALDKVLIYAIGGVAFTDTRNYIGGVGFDGNSTGYDIGGGVEYAFLPNWTLRAEYRYYDFGKVNKSIVSTNFNALVVATNYGVAKTDNTFRVGVAYKFGVPEAAPVVAKY